MKKLILLFLLSSSLYSQKQVFNVQWYCVDHAPYKKGQCDISGNEYSFVFLDVKKGEVIFFFTQMRMEYKIVSSAVDKVQPEYTSYILQNEKGQVEMKINKQKSKVAFLYPDTRIYLTVGNSTKLVSKSAKFNAG